MAKSPLFHRAHYNIIAAQLREHFPVDDKYQDGYGMGLTIHDNLRGTRQRAVITDLALSLAKRFKEDNELFDPLRFLDACSPNVDLYPLSELWED